MFGALLFALATSSIACFFGLSVAQESKLNIYPNQNPITAPAKASLGTKPEFQTSFVNATQVAGKWLILVCEAQGEKPITYKWYNRDEDEITKDEKQLVYVRDWGNDSSSLFFKNVSSEYNGVYICTASNVHGLASKMFDLRVPPSNDIDQAKVLKVADKSVAFHIPTSGSVKYIEAKYKEFKASNVTNIRLNPVPGNNSYEIGNLLPSGLYIFQFRTVPSESNQWSKEYNITLLPDVPEIILENIDDRSIRLQWFTSTDDFSRGTIDRHHIKYYPVEMIDGKHWTSRECSEIQTAIPTCLGSSYTIWGLEKTIFYQIEVRAHTIAGYGAPWRQKVYLIP